MHRSFHIVDIENLAGPGHADLKAVTHASAAYKLRARIGAADHVVVGTNMDAVYRLTVGLAWPGARVVSGQGANGADRALLDAVNPAWIMRRGFDRVVIGSGDRCFASLGTTLKRAGVTVHVVGRPHEIHCSLWPASHLVLPLPLGVPGGDPACGAATSVAKVA
jgi:hypothetical protein